MEATALKANKPKPYDGWALSKTIALDPFAKVGLLHYMVSSTTTARQAGFAVMSLGADPCNHDGPWTPQSGGLEIRADDLVQLPPRDLIKRYFGPVPDGFVGLLSRLGAAPLEQHRYRDLFVNFRDKTDRARALRQYPGEVNSYIVEAALTLDPVAVAPTTIESCASRHGVRRINDVNAVFLTVYFTNILTH